MWPANIFFSPLSCPFHKKEVPTVPQNLVLHFSFTAITNTALWDTVSTQPETLRRDGKGRITFPAESCIWLSPVSFRNLLEHCLPLGPC